MSSAILEGTENINSAEVFSDIVRKIQETPIVEHPYIIRGFVFNNDNKDLPEYLSI